MVVVVVLVLAGDVEAARCGGPVPCRCGDVVTADTTLSADLGPCPGHGLIIEGAVDLNCREARIVGRGGGPPESYGIYLRGGNRGRVSGATVRGCAVSGFHDGIRLRAADGNRILGNTTEQNGDFARHEGYGINLAQASSANILEGNTVRRNADEGIHIGTGSHRNRFVANVVTDNYRENIYALAAHGGVFLRNTAGGRSVNSVYLKDSSDNHLEGNTFTSATARIIGDARDNRLVGNTFTGTGLHVQPYRGQAGRSPTGTRVTGGSITGADICLRFTSSRDSTVTDTKLGDCSTELQSETPAGPAETTVIGIPLSRVVLDGASTLRIGRQLGVVVREPGGQPVAGAQVRATLTDGTVLLADVTDERGAVAPRVVILAVRTSTASPAIPSLRVSVTKSGFASELRTLAPDVEPVSLAVTLRPE
jgi:parallel beta-helix repeat protein